jgi:hypothetical protein
MTQRVNPSSSRPTNSFQTAGAIALAGGSGHGWVSDESSNSDISVQNSNIDETSLNAFQQTSGSSSFDVTIDGGEAFIYGSWVAIDTPTTVTLSSSTTGQTVYVGWDKQNPDSVIIGLESAFSTNTTDSDKKIPLWSFDTDSSGVISTADLRRIGYSQYISGKQYFGEEDYSIEYDSSEDSLVVTDENNNTVGIKYSRNGTVVFENDVTDSNSNTIYSQSNNYVPISILQHSSLSVAGNSVSLGGSTGVRYTDLTDTSSSFPIGNADIDNSFVTVAGNTISLGSSSSISHSDLSNLNSDQHHNQNHGNSDHTTNYLATDGTNDFSGSFSYTGTSLLFQSGSTGTHEMVDNGDLNISGELTENASL